MELIKHKANPTLTTELDSSPTVLKYEQMSNGEIRRHDTDPQPERLTTQIDRVAIKESPLNIDIEKSVGMNTKPSEPSLVPSRIERRAMQLEHERTSFNSNQTAQELIG
jgi:hypothetical protein